MIEIVGLRKSYSDGTEALRGIDITFGSGMLGLLGPNGAGKTTLLSILALHLAPSAGAVRYDGLQAERTADRSAIRSLLGYLPQSFQPVPWLTGREYLWHCAELRRVARGRDALGHRITELLAAVGLQDAADRRAGQYSGGMKRRLGVAQALVHAPRLVIVDEPTAGLDPQERVHFRDLIAEVAEHTAVVLSTHIAEDVEAICPRLAIIAGGRLAYDGPPDALLAEAKDRLWELPGERPPSDRVVPLGRRAGRGGAVREVVWAEVPPADAEPRPATLEDAYSLLLVGQRRQAT